MTKEYNKMLRGEVYSAIDIELTPITVSTQVVAVTNYKFVCKDKSGSTYQVIIYQKLPAHGGEAEVTSIEIIR